MLTMTLLCAGYPPREEARDGENQPKPWIYLWFAPTPLIKAETLIITQLFSYFWGAVGETSF